MMNSTRGVTVAPVPDESRIDVLVGDRLFTAYRYGDGLTKPVLYPLQGPSGTTVTRGYPIEPQPGERVDHPHHVGHWFNYGHVNGLDFWNNAGDDPDADWAGWIRHREIERAESGDPGVLDVRTDWVDADGDRQLREETDFRFRSTGDRHVVDRTTTLEATDGPVELHDDKEGLFAIRVAKELEHPTDGRIEVVGKEGTTEIDAETGRTGQYLSSEGARGTDVWGNRARWMRLSGTVEETPVSITIMDHPDNVGYPTHWHARPYGLFAANPLGRSVFADGEELGFGLDTGESVTFRYRIAIEGGEPDAGELDERHDVFVSADDD